LTLFTATVWQEFLDAGAKAKVFSHLDIGTTLSRLTHFITYRLELEFE
jgi:hypothetical protein